MRCLFSFNKNIPFTMVSIDLSMALQFIINSFFRSLLLEAFMISMTCSKGLKLSCFLYSWDIRSNFLWIWMTALSKSSDPWILYCPSSSVEAVEDWRPCDRFFFRSVMVPYISLGRRKMIFPKICLNDIQVEGEWIFKSHHTIMTAVKVTDSTISMDHDPGSKFIQFPNVTWWKKWHFFLKNDVQVGFKTTMHVERWIFKSQFKSKNNFFFFKITHNHQPCLRKRWP